jgi:hypothetical protein
MDSISPGETTMPRVVENIPDPVAAEAEAARAWFARENKVDFKLTGIVDPEEAFADGVNTDTRDLQLILCGNRDGQDLCLRERFQVRPRDDAAGFEVTHIPNTGPEIGSPAPLLDPPVGVRTGWLQGVMKDYAFVVLVYYRGLW